jgi:hypothetical protein
MWAIDEVLLHAKRSISAQLSSGAHSQCEGN